MDDATAKPFHCPACGSGRVTPPQGAFGETFQFLNTVVYRHCLDCGYVMQFLSAGQIHHLRKRHGLADDPDLSIDTF